MRSDTSSSAETKRQRRNDWILFAVLLAISLLLGVLFLLIGDRGAEVTVTVDGVMLGEYDINQPCRVEIPSGENGAGKNLLVIEDGTARVESASCPDGICVHHRPISREGETIICLPNRVVITVKGG